ncbi:MAG: hypothetical protein M1814_003599 [Vezdaea aestivalis]|nr:MAG: hypothetical protein M1814_003599 [Vezdaea aestivalis]
MDSDSARVTVTFNGDGVRRIGSNPATQPAATPLPTEKEADVEVASVVSAEYRQKQTFGGKTLALLAYQSIGVIYGDIGTSPLYVYSGTFSDNPSYPDLLGALSLIIWAVTIMVSVKYVCIVLQADDEGEGGTFALYSLLSRFANIVKRDPKEVSMIKLERHRTNDLKTSNKAVRSFIENSNIAKIILKVIGVTGVSLVMADGVLTPAQSVLGAIQGLTVVAPNITPGTVVGVSCAILVLLFLVQPLGTAKLGSCFAPIVIVWLTFNASFGVYNLAMHDHSVLKAFSPFFAGDYLVRNKTEGWKALGGILLAFTGVEALFADLGAFSKRSVQLSWLCFAYPCLLLAYIGQAAFLSRDPSAWNNPFFKTVPPGMIYPSLVISVLAAVVASQAMITSSFQLLSQVMKLSYFPHIKLVHTSKRFHGQVYIPLANWLLMIGTVIVTAVYSNTTRLGHAYGVCVILVTFITTCMVSIVALIVWRLNWAIVLVAFIIFGAFDGVFLTSALTKVPQGAWFTIVLASVLSSIFILWRYGKDSQWAAEGEGRISPGQLITANNDGSLCLTQSFGGGLLTKTKGVGIFFDKSGSGKVPTVFSQFIKKFEAYPEVMIFFNMRALTIPAASADERFTILRTAIPNAYRIIIRHGYSEEVVSPDLASLLYEQLQGFIENYPLRLVSNPSETNVNAPAESSETSSGKNSNVPLDEMQSLVNAFDTQIVYVVGKEQMRIRPAHNFFKRTVLNVFLWIRENSRGKVAAMKIPYDRLVEVGFVKEI